MKTELLECSYTPDGNVKWYSHMVKEMTIFLKNLNLDLQYDIAIQLLEIYPQETGAYIKTNTSIQIFTKDIFVIVQTGNSLNILLENLQSILIH